MQHWKFVLVHPFQHWAAFRRLPLARGRCHCFGRNQFEPLERKKKLLWRSRTFSVCTRVVEQHSELVAMDFFPDPAPLLQIQSCSAARRALRWGSAEPAEPCALLGLHFQPSWLPDHPTCPELALPGRAGGAWMEEIVLNACLPVRRVLLVCPLRRAIKAWIATHAKVTCALLFLIPWFHM